MIKYANIKIKIGIINFLTVIFYNLIKCMDNRMNENKINDIEIIETDKSKFDELMGFCVGGKVKSNDKVKGLVK